MGQVEAPNELNRERRDAARAIGSPPAIVLTEEPASMLEAHAPHEPIHTWKGFFIHIATIVIGLLVAVGLEQCVEYVHHHRQLEAARQELEKEWQDNQLKLTKSVEAVQKLNAMLQVDVATLHATRAARDLTWPKLEYSWAGMQWPEDGAWQALKQGGSLVLMPQDELKRYAYLYDGIAAVQAASIAYAMQSDMAASLAQRPPDARVLSGDIQEMLAATAQCLGKLRFLETTLRLERIGLVAARRSSID